VGLVARHVEAAGIPTLCMSSALDITRSVNPPRAAFLDFPLGHTTGKPNQPELQRKILADALSSFEAMTVPGSVRALPYRWSDDEGWKDRAFAEGDERKPRHDTPQYQDEEDRRRAEAGGSPSCPVCRS
jgi:D-proline reductase (dithiol) PrdB